MYGNKIKFSYYDEGFHILKVKPYNKYSKLFEIHLRFYNNIYYIINQNIIKVLFKISQYKEKELNKYETAICLFGVLNDKHNVCFSVQEKIDIMAENYVYLLNYLKRKGKYRRFLKQYDFNSVKEKVLKHNHTEPFYFEKVVWLFKHPKLYMRIFSVDWL